MPRIQRQILTTLFWRILRQNCVQRCVYFQLRILNLTERGRTNVGAKATPPMLDAGDLNTLVGLSLGSKSSLRSAQPKKSDTSGAFERPASLPFASDESLFSSPVGSSQPGKNFKVVVRIRPPITREKDAQSALCLTVEGKQVVNVKERGDKQYDDKQTGFAYTFAFDRVFDMEMKQEQIYNAAVKPVVKSILEGYNGSIIAYGQTSTGKTYTMEGGEMDHRGVIPRASEEIFNFIETQSDSKSTFLVRASFLQIYNEKIMDLLDPLLKKGLDQRGEKVLKVREGSSGVYVESLSEHIVKSPLEIENLVKRGALMRATAQTKMNRESSRSHAVFTIIVEHATLNEETQEKTILIGKLNLVDLAGSERLKSTEAEGSRLQEAIKINASLSAFGKVILALTSSGKQHIPYRDSTLTRILQDSLGGNCKTTLITTVTPVALSYGETISTLKFANRAKKVKNYAVINQDVSQQALLSKYEQEIKKLRRALTDRQVQGESLVDKAELLRIESQWAQVAKEKETVESELAKRVEEVQQTKKEKSALQGRIKELEERVLLGGTRAEETPEFKSAVQKAQEQLQTEYEAKFKDLEKERELLQREKMELQAKQQQLERDKRLTEAEDVSSTRRASPQYAWGQSQQPSRSSWYDTEDLLGEETLQDEPDPDPSLQPYINAMKDDDTGIPLQDRQYNLSIVKSTFTGYDASVWFMENMHGVESLEQATTIGQNFLDLDIFENVGGTTVFTSSDRDIYRFREVATKPRRPVSVSSASYSSRPASSGSSTFYQYGAGSSRPLYSPPSGDQMSYYDLSQRRVSVAHNADSTFSSRGSTSFSDSRASGDSFDDGSVGADAGSNPLHSAAEKGDRSIVKSLIATYGVDCTDFMGRTPLTYAVMGNKIKCCDALLKSGADVAAQDRNGRTPLLWAAYYGHAEIIKLLLAKNKSLAEMVDPEGRTALHWAAKPDSPKALEALAKFCSSRIVNYQDDDQTTALQWSILCNHPVHARVLLRQCGADPAIRDIEGRTAFHYAVVINSLDLIQELLDWADDCINEKDERGRTPLHLAVSSEGSLEMVTLLLSSSFCDVNSTDMRMTAPLHWASVCNRPDVARALLQRGAKLTIRDVNGMTPLHYATKKGFNEVAHVLQRFGASSPVGRPSSPRQRRPQSPVLQRGPQPIDLALPSTLAPIQSRSPSRSPRARHGSLTRGSKMPVHQGRLSPLPTRKQSGKFA
ncbi:uncharacterized protein [Oscarella lobularis]|uniref:uncharacterized protein n=1 Tax=Oscarella lobularis TaxID=121494 RepID=UPI00331318FB